MPKRSIVPVAGTALAVVAVASLTGLYVWHHTAKPTTAVPLPDSAYRTTILQLASASYRLDIADTPELKTLGLGQRQSLAPNSGMLFPYEAPGHQCFWMKDMRFAIDIVWLDAQKKVVHIEPSLSPATYPQTFCPDTPAQYVIELPAGAAKQDGIGLDDRLQFDI